MIIEIGYTYQSDNQGPALDSWTYFYVKGDDFDKNKKKAQTYWKKFIADLGWQKKAKLVHIQEIQNGKTTLLLTSLLTVGSCLLPGSALAHQNHQNRGHHGHHGHHRHHGQQGHRHGRNRVYHCHYRHDGSVRNCHRGHRGRHAHPRQVVPFSVHLSF